MRLVHTLKINGEAVQVSGYVVTLELSEVGRGVFKVSAPATPAVGDVGQWSAGLGDGLAVPVLGGIVTEVHPDAAGAWRVVVKETTAALGGRAWFQVRHGTARDILKQIEALTGTAFVLPAADYATERIANFSSIGTGRDALDLLGASLGIQAVWAGMPDGSIYWGTWHDSPFNAETLDLPEAVVGEFDPDAQAVQTGPLPQARPGIPVRVWRDDFSFEFVIAKVLHHGGKTRLSWEDFSA